MDIYDVSFNDISVKMAVEDPLDTIQRHYVRGKFYEVEELSLLSNFLQNNEIIIDIGANVGNHTIFLNQLENVKAIYPVEPNPRAVKIMFRNIELNNSIKVDTRFLGIAFSDKPGSFDLSQHEHNLGGVRLRSSNSGIVNSVVGDNLLSALDIQPTLIKIDVEGHEGSVIKGLRNTISTYLPAILVEVHDSHSALIDNLLKEFGYEIIWRNRRYKNNENWFAVSSFKNDLPYLH